MHPLHRGCGRGVEAAYTFNSYTFNSWLLAVFYDAVLDGEVLIDDYLSDQIRIWRDIVEEFQVVVQAERKSRRQRPAEASPTKSRQNRNVTTAAKHPPRTRIQTEKRGVILEAALDVFSLHGFRGSTIDQIAAAAGMSKPNLLYYFRRKEDIHNTLIKRLLDTWLQPLRELDDVGDPIAELRDYIRRKLEMARDFPREGRLFANEILQGAPHTMSMLVEQLKPLVDEKVALIQGWMRAGHIVQTDPYHLIFSIWATTQHYADYDIQVRTLLGPKRDDEERFEDAARFLEQLFLHGLLPKA